MLEVVLAKGTKQWRTNYCKWLGTATVASIMCLCNCIYTYTICVQRTELVMVNASCLLYQLGTGGCTQKPQPVQGVYTIFASHDCSKNWIISVIGKERLITYLSNISQVISR